MGMAHLVSAFGRCCGGLGGQKRGTEAVRNEVFSLGWNRGPL